MRKPARPSRYTNRVRELRLFHGMTQAALADAVGVSRQTILAIERGRIVPRVTTALRIARVFHLPCEEVFVFTW